MVLRPCHARRHKAVQFAQHCQLPEGMGQEVPVVSPEERAQIIAKDKKEMLHRVKVAWIASNGSFRGSAQTNPCLVCAFRGLFPLGSGLRRGAAERQILA